MTSRSACIAALFSLLLPAVALAHGVDAVAKLANGRVTVEVFFDDDTPAADAKVTVAYADKKPVAEGKTDETGRWSFPAPPPGRYRIVADAGAGHRVTKVVTIDGSELHPAEAADPVVVSQGASREETTGPTKFLWVAAGLVIIALGTWTFIRVARLMRSPNEPA